MTLEKNYKVFKVGTGEIVILEITDILDDGMYVIQYPAVIVPIPPQQAGGKSNQIGFGKLMPFSDYGKDITMNPASILIDSSPDSRMVDAYENWCTQVKQQESGIIIPPKGATIPTVGKADNINRPNFRNGLNT
jgi:hypothetical protein